jgi:predicted PurR-regulated permease PerM
LGTLSVMISPEEPRARRAPGVPPLLQDAAGWCWRILVVAAAITLLGMLARKLELVVIPLLTALLLTALLEPIAARLRRLRLPRALSAIVTVLLAIAVLGGVGAFVYDRAAAGYPQLVDQIGHLVDQTQSWLATGPLHVKQAGDLGTRIADMLRSRQGQIASSALSAGRTLADVVTDVVLTLFLTLFLLYDGPRIWAWLTGLFPDSAREQTDKVGERMWRTLSGYVTGTFLVALFHGVVMGVTLAIVGVPLVAPLAVLIFIGGFIPLIGVVVFGGLAVLVTLVTKSAAAGVVVLIVLVIENQIESHVLQPFVVGRHVRLHPMAIALTLASGAVIAGLPGAIFAVPLVAALNAAAVQLRPAKATDVTPSAAEVEQQA